MDAHRYGHIAQKAARLDRLISQPLTDRQLFNRAQEAALAYHQVSNLLMNRPQQNREQLARLGKLLSWIESEAMRKFYTAGTACALG